jgi:hypothetical protein
VQRGGAAIGTEVVAGVGGFAYGMATEGTWQAGLNYANLGMFAGGAVGFASLTLRRLRSIRLNSIRPLRVSNREIIVMGGNAQKSGVLQPRLPRDRRGLGGLPGPSRSASLAIDLTAETEIPAMFGRALTKSDTISAAFVADVRAAGFAVFRTPTTPNPLHVSILPRHRTFDQEGLEWLTLAFSFLKRG